jgi:hypothetical protein
VTKNSSTIAWYRNGVAQTALTGANTANYPTVTTSINTVRIGSSISAADKGLIGQVDQFRIYAAAVASAEEAGYAGSMNDMNLSYSFDALSGGVFLNDVTQHASADAVALTFGGTLDTTVKKFGAGSLKNTGGTPRNSTGYVMPVGSHTFVFWIYLDPNMGSNRYLMGWSTSSLSNKVFGLRTNESAGPYTVWAYSDGASVMEFKNATTSGTTLAASTWHHVAAVFNTAGSCTLYLNSVQQQTVTFASAMDTTNARVYRDFMCLPGGSGGTANQDDFRHYERALSAAEISALYYSGPVVNPNFGVSPPTLTTNSVSATLSSVVGWTLATLAGSPTVALINGTGGGWASYTYPSPATQMVAFQLPSGGASAELSQSVYITVPGAYVFSFYGIGRSNTVTATGCQKRHSIQYSIGANSMTTGLRVTNGSPGWVAAPSKFSIPCIVSAAGYVRVAMAHTNDDASTASTANVTKVEVVPLALPSSLVVANPNFASSSGTSNAYVEVDNFTSWSLSGPALWQINNGGWTPLTTTPATLPGTVTSSIGVQFTNTANGGYGMVNSARVEQYVYVPAAGNYVMSFSVAPRNAASYAYYTTAHQVTGSFNGNSVTSSVGTPGTFAWTTYSLASSAVAAAGYYKVSFVFNCTATNATNDSSLFLCNVQIN